MAMDEGDAVLELLNTDDESVNGVEATKPVTSLIDSPVKGSPKKKGPKPGTKRKPNLQASPIVDKDGD